jgi:hypothetical protein
MYYDSKELFSVMQRIPGVQLNSIWPSLADSEKDDIIAKLQQICDAMRKAECPWPDFFGGLDGDGLSPANLPSLGASSVIIEPWSTETNIQTTSAAFTKNTSITSLKVTGPH